jgi:hypothetical protein
MLLSGPGRQAIDTSKQLIDKTKQAAYDTSRGTFETVQQAPYRVYEKGEVLLERGRAIPQEISQVCSTAAFAGQARPCSPLQVSVVAANGFEILCPRLCDKDRLSRDGCRQRARKCTSLWTRLAQRSATPRSRRSSR